MSRKFISVKNIKNILFSYYFETDKLLKHIYVYVSICIICFHANEYYGCCNRVAIQFRQSFYPFFIVLIVLNFNQQRILYTYFPIFISSIISHICRDKLFT